MKSTGTEPVSDSSKSQSEHSAQKRRCWTKRPGPGGSLEKRFLREPTCPEELVIDEDPTSSKDGLNVGTGPPPSRDPSTVGVMSCRSFGNPGHLRTDPARRSCPLSGRHHRPLPYHEVKVKGLKDGTQTSSLSSHPKDF